MSELEQQFIRRLLALVVLKIAAIAGIAWVLLPEPASIDPAHAIAPAAPSGARHDQ